MAWKYLRRNHSCAIPRRLIVFTTATDTHVDKIVNSSRWHKLRLGVAIAGRITEQGWTAEQVCTFRSGGHFWEFVEDQCGRDYTTWVISPNAVFDCTTSNLWELFTRKHIRLSRPGRSRTTTDGKPGDKKHRGICVIEDPPTILGAEFVKSGKRFWLLDSANYFRMSLDVLGRIIDKPRHSERWENNVDAGIISRLERDVRIVLETFVKFAGWHRRHDLGQFGWSMPAIAMHAFRHRFMPLGICLHNESPVKELERSAYYGGQTEVYRHGAIAGKCHQLDVTSLYPSVMLTGKYPVKLHRWDTSAPLGTDRPSICPAHSVAEVYLQADEYRYPVRGNGKLRFARGRFKTVLAGPELDHAVRHGHVLLWGKWAEYKCKPIFAAYVRYLWELKHKYNKSGDQLYRHIVKLLLNSLYGKFGQKSAQWESRPDVVAKEPWLVWRQKYPGDERRRTFRSIGWDTEEQIEPTEHGQSFPAIAAFVTAAGRLRMAVLRKQFGAGNVYYQGVDSLLVSDAGLTLFRLTHKLYKHALGKLRLESTADNCNVIGKYCYKIGDKSVMSGRKWDADIASDDAWTQREFSGIAGIFRHSSDTRHSSLAEVREELVEKHLHTGRAKFETAENGSTYDLTLSEPWPLAPAK